MNDGEADVWRDAIRAREQLLGEETVRRMAEMFVDDLDELLSRTQEALHAGQTDLARQAIHNLGGNAGCLDFNDLALAIQNAERACVEGLTEEALTRMNRITPMARQKAELLRRHYRIT